MAFSYKTIMVDEYEFEYSDPELFLGRYTTHMRASKHGITMGYIVYFGKNKPSEKQIVKRITSESKWCIKANKKIMFNTVT